MDNRKRLLQAMGDKIGPRLEKPGRLYFQVAAGDWPEVARFLFRDLGCRLSTATAAETARGIEVLYHFSLDSGGEYFCPRLVCPRGPEPRLPSIAGLCKGADWIEREMAELWGISFDGHPDPRPLLTRDAPESLRGVMRLRRRS